MRNLIEACIDIGSGFILAMLIVLIVLVSIIFYYTKTHWETNKNIRFPTVNQQAKQIQQQFQQQIKQQIMNKVPVGMPIPTTYYTPTPPPTYI